MAQDEIEGGEGPWVTEWSVYGPISPRRNKLQRAWDAIFGSPDPYYRWQLSAPRLVGSPHRAHGSPGLFPSGREATRKKAEIAARASASAYSDMMNGKGAFAPVAEGAE